MRSNSSAQEIGIFAFLVAVVVFIAAQGFSVMLDSLGLPELLSLSEPTFLQHRGDVRAIMDLGDGDNEAEMPSAAGPDLIAVADTQIEDTAAPPEVAL